MFGFLSLSNLWRRTKISLSIQTVVCSLLATLVEHRVNFQEFQIWWSGLRGPMAFALALNFPGENRHFVLTTSMSSTICLTNMGMISILFSAVRCYFLQFHCWRTYKAVNIEYGASF